LSLAAFGYDPADGREDGRTRVNRGTKVTPRTLLVLALVLGALLGCGPERTGEAPQTTARTAEPTAEETTSAPSVNVAERAAAGVEEAEIREHLDRLTGVSPAPLGDRRVTISERGSEGGRRAAAEYLESSFEEMGVPARILEFESGGLRGFNVEATLRGQEGGKHLWVTAHLDSVNNAGANDDASGLASILLTAEALEELDPEHTVHFVAFDLEELGLYGSTHYVANTVGAIEEREGEEAIIGALQSDMIGYEEDRFDATLGTCDRAGPIDDAMSQASKMLDSPIRLREVCLGRSDHEPFWDAGLPAAVLTDGAIYDGYPCYHEPCDTVDKLNVRYLRSMIQLTAAATALLAENRA
jgi:hypothetical protein